MRTRTLAAHSLRAAFIALALLLPLLVTLMARAAEDVDPGDPGGSLVTLRRVEVTGEDRRVRAVPASCPARLLERRGSRLLVDVKTPAAIVRGLADPTAFLELDRAGETVETLVAKAELVLGQEAKPVLAAALASEALRREPSRVDAWRLLALAGEQLAATSRPGEGGTAPLGVSLGELWGLRVHVTRDGKGYRYDGAAWRRVAALSPPEALAEEARVRLLTRCGPSVDLSERPPDVTVLRQRERDLFELLSSFPTSGRRPSMLLERAQVLAVLAEHAARSGQTELALADRDAAVDALSEVTSTESEAAPARRRTADRLLARLTRSFPKPPGGTAVVSTSGHRAWLARIGSQTFLHVAGPDGKDAIQPVEVPGADPASLTFDPSGARIAWDEVPSLGRRRTRVIDLQKARLYDPAAFAEPELLGVGKPAADGDRYTTLVGFSPDGSSLLVASEGFTKDGLRIPRRHFLCDPEGKRLPVLVQRPYAAPGQVDWTRLLSETARLSG